MDGGGDFIPTNVYFPASKLPWIDSAVTLYLEGIEPSQSLADQSISVKIGELSDVVKATVFGCKLVQIVSDACTMECDDRIEPAHPSPEIHIEHCVFSYLRVSDDKTKILASINMRGTVKSSLCDLVEGSAGKIDHLLLYLNGSTDPLAVIPVDVSKATERNRNSFLKPFAYSGSFERTLDDIEVHVGNNLLLFTATDVVPLFEITGYNEQAITVNDHMPERDVDVASIHITLPTDPEAADTIAVELSFGEDSFGGDLTETGPDTAIFTNGENTLTVTLSGETASVTWEDGGMEDYEFDLKPVDGSSPPAMSGTVSRPEEDWEMEDWEDWTFEADPPVFVRTSADGYRNNYCYARQMQGPTEFFPLIQDVQWAGVTRKIVEGPDKLFYLSAKGDDQAPAVFQHLPAEPAGPPAGLPQGNAWDFTKGFCRGFWDGGVSLVEGAAHLIKKSVELTLGFTQMKLIYRLVSGDTFEAERRMFADTYQVVKTLAGISLEIQKDKFAIIESIMIGDWEAVGVISEPYRAALEVSIEILQVMFEELKKKTRGEQGYFAGRALFEIASIVVPIAKVAQIGKLAALSKLRTMKILASGPGAKMLEKIVELIAFFTKWSDCCFVAGTLVHTKHGLVKIEELRGGDEVRTRTESGVMEFKPILEALVTAPGSLLEVNVEFVAPDGEKTWESIICTPEHPFQRQQDGFVAASELGTGDMLFALSGATVSITSITSRAASGSTYNLRVAPPHNFFVGVVGVLVHNAALRGRTCDRVASLYFRSKRLHPGDAAVIWGKIEAKLAPDLAKLSKAEHAVLGSALEKVIREELFAGSSTAKIWTSTTKLPAPGESMFFHYMQHVIKNKSVIPGGEFPHLEGNAFRYFQEAFDFSKLTEPNVARWVDESGDTLIMAKTEPYRWLVISGESGSQGAFRTYHIRNKLRNIDDAGNPISAWLWIKLKRQYSGPQF